MNGSTIMNETIPMNEPTTDGILMYSGFERDKELDLFRSVPRFGHSNDLSNWFSTSPDERMDYIYGVFYWFVLLTALVVFWSSLLLLLQCLGGKRTGFFSGSRFAEPTTRKSCSQILVRLMFITAAASVMASCGMFYVYGSQRLEEGVEDIQIGLQSMIKAIPSNSHSIQELDETKRLGSQAVQQLKTCFGSSSEGDGDGDGNDIGSVLGTSDKLLESASSSSSSSSYSTTKTEKEIRQLMEAIETFSSIGGNPNSRYDFPDATSAVEHFLDSVNNKLGDVLQYQSYIVISFLPIVAATAFMLWLGAIMAWCRFHKRLECVMGFLWRFMMLLAVISWVAGVAVGVTGVVHADFCSGGVAPGNPDDSINNIMVQLNLPQTNPDIYEYVSYHIHGCTHSPDMLSSIIDTLLINNDNDILGEECENPDKTTQSLVAFQRSLQTLQSYTFQQNQDCAVIYNMYTEITHNTACTDLPVSLGCATALLWAIGFYGMIMITLRSSLQASVVVNKDTYDGVNPTAPSFSQKSDSSKSFDKNSIHNSYSNSKSNGSNGNIVVTAAGRQNSRAADDNTSSASFQIPRGLFPNDDLYSVASSLPPDGAAVHPSYDDYKRGVRNGSSEASAINNAGEGAETSSMGGGSFSLISYGNYRNEKILSGGERGEEEISNMVIQIDKPDPILVRDKTTVTSNRTMTESSWSLMDPDPEIPSYDDFRKIRNENIVTDVDSVVPDDTQESPVLAGDVEIL